MQKIFVCYSCDSPILLEFQAKPDMYVPIKCGDYENSNIQFSDKIGNSISNYNKYVNEMTMIWTIGKNLNMFGDFDYVGTAHYRRYLSFLFSQLQPNNILACKDNVNLPIWQLYKQYHNISDLQLFISFFNKIFPDLQNELVEYLNQTSFYKCNIFMMHKDVFNQYFIFIEKCILIMIHNVLPLLNEELKTRDRYQIRVGGFILERMTSFWIWLQNKRKTFNIINASIVEANINSIYSRP